MCTKSEQLLCSTKIDYSKILGKRILPFLIELDLEASNLYPDFGENQRFCYIVTGIGEDTSQFANLSHWVLGICDEITEDEIVNITVFINGVKQTVTFPGNVELKTHQKPDPTTGCPGLKFDFGLNKVNGVMNVCFELTTPRQIGPNPVCLKGGTQAASGLSICGPACGEMRNCVATAYQRAIVCVPVTVTPFVTPGITTTYCCDDPLITSGTVTCGGKENGSCTFTITQDICILIPVDFGATATTSDPFVQCDSATGEDVCTDCGSEEGAK